MDDLKLIKKHYGENMMHLCRESFPTLLETEGLLWFALTKKFPYSKNIADDIIEMNAQNEFKNIIYEEINVKDNDKIVVNKTPKELLSEVGYDLYECKTEEDIQEFRKYYYKSEKDKKYQFMTNYGVPSYIGEELCTFGGGRLNRCYVFFAVKKNVDEIKRENFKNPDRQDEYGTSVISIQFTRDDSNTLSIKNRYNHRVNHPDSTFSNNLDNIIPGLTESFNKTYNLNINNSSNRNFDLPGYVLANDGKYYPYNYEINNIYYCPDNIIIDNFEVKKYDKSRYIIIQHFIIDLVNKTIKKYDDNETEESFLETIPEINDIKVRIDKTSKNKTIIINNEIIIEVNNRSEIIKYENKLIKEIPDYFISYNTDLKEINIPNVERIGNYFLESNKKLEEINMPHLQLIGNGFLTSNFKLKKINIPNVEEIGNSFLLLNDDLKEINLPKVKKIGNSFLCTNNKIESIDFPECEYFGEIRNNNDSGNIFLENTVLKYVNLPKAKALVKGTFYSNTDIEYINIPNVSIIYNYVLEHNTKLKEIYLPNVKVIGDSFLKDNNCLEIIEMGNIEEESYEKLSEHIKELLKKKTR